MRVEVLKELQAGEKRLRPGEIVDAAGWTLLRQLIDQRYVREAPHRKPVKEANHV